MIQIVDESIKIDEVFRPLWESKKRYFLLTGGRNSGKSFAVKLYEHDISFDKGNKILDTRYTMNSAHDSVIPEFMEKLELKGSLPLFDIRKKEAVNKLSNSSILFRGIKTSSGIQTANLKSLQGVNIWILDEAEELIDEETFDKIDLSIRQLDVPNKVIMIMNPTTKEHWIWKRWFEGHLKYVKIDGFEIPISNHPDICHIHSTYFNNLRNIPEDYLNKINELKINNPAKYRHVILGGWLEKAEGAIYTNWEVGAFDESLSYGYGLDFGFFPDPDACVKVGIDRKRKLIYLDEVFYKNSQGTEDLRNELKNRIRNGRLIIADSAENRLINDLRKDFNIKPVVKKPGSVEENIKLIQDYRLIVTSNSQNLISELNNYAWHDKKSNTPIDKYNHLCDAFRYYFMDMNKRSGVKIL